MSVSEALLAPDQHVLPPSAQAFLNAYPVGRATVVEQIGQAGMLPSKSLRVAIGREVLISSYAQDAQIIDAAAIDADIESALAAGQHARDEVARGDQVDELEFVPQHELDEFWGDSDGTRIPEQKQRWTNARKLLSSLVKRMGVV